MRCSVRRKRLKNPCLVSCRVSQIFFFPGGIQALGRGGRPALNAGETILKSDKDFSIIFLYLVQTNKIKFFVLFLSHPLRSCIFYLLQHLQKLLLPFPQLWSCRSLTLSPHPAPRNTGVNELKMLTGIGALASEWTAQVTKTRAKNCGQRGNTFETCSKVQKKVLMQGKCILCEIKVKYPPPQKKIHKIGKGGTLLRKWLFIVRERQKSDGIIRGGVYERSCFIFKQEKRMHKMDIYGQKFFISVNIQFLYSLRNNASFLSRGSRSRRL